MRIRSAARYLLSLWGILLACGCGNGSGNSGGNGDGSSGIRGVVTGTGGASAGLAQPLSGATIKFRDTNGTEVGRRTSDSGGSFTINLAPGRYTVDPQTYYPAGYIPLIRSAHSRLIPPDNQTFPFPTTDTPPPAPSVQTPTPQDAASQTIEVSPGKFVSIAINYQ